MVIGLAVASAARFVMSLKFAPIIRAFAIAACAKSNLAVSLAHLPAATSIISASPAAAIFESSDDAERGFCSACGTPLTYKAKSRPRISVSIGSLDRHGEMQPQFQYGLESREPWFAKLENLPGTHTGEGDNGEGDTAERFEKIRVSNHQHPDCDTPHWP